MPTDIRADNLGSLLRPSYLLDVRHAGGDADQLRSVEDRAIEEAIALQEDVGLHVITDGEYRRRFFFSTIKVLLTEAQRRADVASGAGDDDRLAIALPVAGRLRSAAHRQ